ncbi:hypothetical protein G9A89_003725 [Geosiphon pyriformis]|nr:hypothetical protein G9A89_003725 [Geosiphon pyriformis]
MEITQQQQIQKTETSNKGKQRLKQYSRTTPNTPTLQKTPAKHLQTPEQGTSVKLPLSITPFPISLKNESNHSESLESKETKSEPEKITENEEKMATAYIAKIPEFTGEDNNTSPQEWLDKVQKAEDANGWITAKMLKAIPYFLQETAEEWFENLEELFENWQAFKDAFLQQFTKNNTSITLRNHFHNIKQETSKTFIAGLKDKLIKKVCSHAPVDLATAIRHAKSYEMAMKETNHTKLVNLAIGETSLAAEEKIDQLTKKNTGNKIVGNYKETNKTEVINVTLHHNNPITNLYYQPIIHQDHKIKTTPPTQQYQVPAKRLVQQNQFTPQNQLQSNHNRINSNNQLVPRNSDQQRPNYYHTQPSYLTIPEESDFQQTALFEDIFPFEFEANESPFLLSNAAVNKQKAITAMYTEITVEGKPIHLILDSRSAGNRPAQTVIVTADDIKKTPVREIDDFLFTIDEITIPVKVFIMDASQYQALVRNDWLLKANANLNWKTQELKISYQEQYTIVPATCAPVFEFEEEKEMPLTETYMALGSPSNWAEETEQEIFKESREWKKKLSSMRACIFPEEKYETCTCYFCKACYREQFGSLKRNMLPEECNWIDIAMRGEVCDQTCQYALSISEKVRKGTLFDAAYNSALNKLYYYPHDTEIIFDLAMALINRATQEDVHQMKEAEYIEYTIELARFNYEDKVETNHQIPSHTYPTKEAQIQ